MPRGGTFGVWLAVVRVTCRLSDERIKCFQILCPVAVWLLPLQVLMDFFFYCFIGAVDPAIVLQSLNTVYSLYTRWQCDTHSFWWQDHFMALKQYSMLTGGLAVGIPCLRYQFLALPCDWPPPLSVTSCLPSRILNRFCKRCCNFVALSRN